ncbi:MAG: glycosyltransferase family 39 protein [Lachnospiraceae bacterium]|nr:glycosyltransferase family 39 protein [Lachnospiraceae bacterium]
MIKKSFGRYLPLIAVLAAYLFLLLYLGSYKLYLYEDEVLSYTSANSETGMYIELESDKWYDGSLVQNAVTAMPGETFHYANTLKNSFADNHPPLHTLLVHTACSFFPGRFSKWYGLSVNIIAGLFLLIVLYQIGLLIFDGRRMPSCAFLLSLVFSLGFTDTLLTIRNYTLLMLGCSIYMLLHLKALKENRVDRRFFLLLFCSAVFGMMCHYYFLTVAFYISAFFCLRQLFQKHFRDFGIYVVTMVLAGIATILILPDIISDIFFSQSGSGNFALRNMGELINRFKTTYLIINQDIFFGRLKFFLLAAFIILILAVLHKRKDGIEAGSSKGIPVLTGFLERHRLILLPAFTCLCFYIIGSATLTYLATRYLSPIYPFLVLLLTFFADRICGLLFRNQSVGLAIFIFLMILPMYDRISAGLTDHNKILMTEAAELHSSDDCVLISGFPLEENFFELQRFHGFCQISSHSDTKDPRITEAKELVVYIPNGKDSQECISLMQKLNPGLTKAERLYVAYYSTAWLLQSEE